MMTMPYQIKMSLEANRKLGIIETVSDNYLCKSKNTQNSEWIQIDLKTERKKYVDLKRTYKRHEIEDNIRVREEKLP